MIDVMDYVLNTTYSYNECVEPPDDWALVLGMVVTSVVMVVGTLGNLLTLCTLFHQFRMPRRHRFIKDLTADNVLITNLAVADLFYSSINIPFIFVTYYRLHQQVTPWEEDSVPCMVSAFLRYTNAISEWTTLGLMALERCVNIYKFRSHQKTSRWFTPHKTALYCCLIWAISMMCQFPTLFGIYGRYGYNADFAKCDFIEEKNSTRLLPPRVMFFALESMVPCILILIGYVVILIQVYSNSARLVPFLRSKIARQTVDLRRSKTTRVIAKLLLVYLICVIPICGYNIAVTGSEGDKHSELGIVFYCIYWCQYFINNFIYVVSNERYRNAYCQFICLILCKEIPRPPLPPHATGRCRNVPKPIFYITLDVQADRLRTISECEESKRTMNSIDYQTQQDSSCSSSLTLDGSGIFPSSSSYPMICANIHRTSVSESTKDLW